MLAKSFTDRSSHQGNPRGCRWDTRGYTFSVRFGGQ